VLDSQDLPNGLTVGPVRACSIACEPFEHPHLKDPSQMLLVERHQDAPEIERPGQPAAPRA